MGKTSTVLRYVENKFESKHLSTLQVQSLSPASSFLFYISKRMGIFVNFFGEKKYAENKNPFQGPSLQASLGVRLVRAETKRELELMISISTQNPLLQMSLSLLTTKIQNPTFSHFFQAAFMNKKVTVKGQQVIWDKDKPCQCNFIFHLVRFTYQYGTRLVKKDFMPSVRSTTGTHTVKLLLTMII